ncbi:MAG TPA: sulfotransferase [Humisphaera sp.]|nr:sulfotransferase [Humisphaera sp.]
MGNILGRCPRTMVFTEPFNPELSLQPARVCNYRFDDWFTYVTAENEAPYIAPLRRMLDLQHPTLTHLRESRNLRDIIDVTARGARFRLSKITTRHSIIKDPIALLSSEWLAQKFAARVVVIIRHPAAVVSSFLRLKFGAGLDSLLRQPLLMRDCFHPIESELREMSHMPCDDIDAVAMLWKSLYFAVLCFQERHPDWLFIRYEDLSLDTVGGIEKMCRHVGLSFTERVRRAVIHSNDPSLPPEVDVKAAFTTRRNTALALTNWKQRLTAAEIVRVRRRVEDVSDHFYSAADW